MLNDPKYQEYEGNDLAIFSRACVFKMYHTQVFSTSVLKEIFLFNSLPVAETSTPRSIKSCVDTWINKIGSMEKTMHWAKEELYHQIHRMMRLSDEKLAFELHPGSITDSMTNGVMDVMFLASCFNFPLVRVMGDRFWSFTKELINLQVSSSNHLNSLLWGLVLPQTVVILDAKRYEMDPLLTPISVDITIKGSYLETASHSLQSDQVVEKTVLAVNSETKLFFTASARLMGITFEQVHYSSLVSKRSDTVMEFMGWGFDPLVLFMKDVHLVNAGCSVSAFDKVHCSQCSVTDSELGFHVTNVKDLFFSGGDLFYPKGSGVKTGFFNCELSLYVRDVFYLLVCQQHFDHCDTVFDFKVQNRCIVENCKISSCNCMGAIMTSPNCTPSLIDLVVSLSLSSFFIVFQLMYGLQVDKQTSPLEFDANAEELGLVSDVVYVFMEPRILPAISLKSEETRDVPQ